MNWDEIRITHSQKKDCPMLQKTTRGIGKEMFRCEVDINMKRNAFGNRRYSNYIERNSGQLGPAECSPCLADFLRTILQ